MYVLRLKTKTSASPPEVSSPLMKFQVDIVINLHRITKNIISGNVNSKLLKHNFYYLLNGQLYHKGPRLLVKQYGYVCEDVLG